MGTWAAPQTAAEAEELRQWMANPIPPNQIAMWPWDGGLVGDDDLADRVCAEYPADDTASDVRWLIAEQLHEWFAEDRRWMREWEPEAITICKRLVQQYHRPNGDEC